MNNIAKKYSDSLEYKRDQLYYALQKQFNQDYDIKATFPDDQIIIVRDWSVNEYFEIAYTLENDKYMFGEPIKSNYEELFDTTQIVNSMKQGHPLILLNSELDNPVYRMLVQTPGELPAQDMGLDKIKYDSEGIKTAISGLLGEYVYDKSQSNHTSKRNGTITENKFSQVVNTGYCPDYGGFVDLEIFDKDYVPLMEQALNSRNKGLPVKEGPSTEMVPVAGEKYGDNNLLLTEWSYNGLVWDKNPRDKSTGVCSTILNSLDDIIGDDKVTDKIEIPKTEYEELIQTKTEKENLETELETGKGLYTKGKELYTKAKDEIQDLKTQLIPVWTAQEEQKVQLVNSLVERVPEAEQETMKTFYEAKDYPELEIIGKQILNSLPGEPNDGVLDGQNPPAANSDVTKEYEASCKALGINPYK